MAGGVWRYGEEGDDEKFMILPPPEHRKNGTKIKEIDNLTLKNKVLNGEKIGQNTAKDEGFEAKAGKTIQKIAAKQHFLDAITRRK